MVGVQEINGKCEKGNIRSHALPIHVKPFLQIEMAAEKVIVPKEFK